MATLSLISGNCGRGRGDGNGLIWHFSNKFLAGDVHGRLRLRNFEAPRLGHHGRNFRVVAGVRKGKKHDYPWPDNIDPNSNAPLTYLSPFKPLEEKPKPVTLAFEKPLIDLEQKIIEVQRMASDTGLDFTDQIKALEMKYEQAGFEFELTDLDAVF